MKFCFIAITMFARLLMSGNGSEQLPPIDIYYLYTVQIIPNPAVVGDRVELDISSYHPQDEPLKYLWMGIGPKGAIQFNSGINDKVKVHFYPDTAGNYKFTVVINNSHDTISATAYLTVIALPKLAISNNNLKFGKDLNTQSFKIVNWGSKQLTATLAEDEDWLTIGYTTPIILDPKEDTTVEVNILRDSIDYSTSGNIRINSDGGDTIINLWVEGIAPFQQDSTICLEFPTSKSDQSSFIDIGLSADTNLNVNITNDMICMNNIRSDELAWVHFNWVPEFIGDEWEIELNVTNHAYYAHKKSAISMLMIIDSNDVNDSLNNIMYPDDEGDTAKIVGLNLCLLANGVCNLSLYNINPDFRDGIAFYRCTPNYFVPEFNKKLKGFNHITLMSTHGEFGEMVYVCTINDIQGLIYPIKIPCSGFYFGIFNCLEQTICFKNISICALTPFKQEISKKMKTLPIKSKLIVNAKVNKYPYYNWNDQPVTIIK
jgi:hypothetical protein